MLSCMGFLSTGTNKSWTPMRTDGQMAEAMTISLQAKYGRWVKREHVWAIHLIMTVLSLHERLHVDMPR